MLVILFHDFRDDRVDEPLNRALIGKGVNALDDRNPVQVVDIAEGRLVVCWDTAPTQQQLQAIESEVEDAGEQAKIYLVFHNSSRYNSEQKEEIRKSIFPGYTREEFSEDGCDIVKEYTHDPHTAMYQDLLRMLQ